MRLTRREREAAAFHTLSLAAPEGALLPYFATGALDAPSVGISQAVFVVHGAERDGYRYFRALRIGLKKTGPDIAARTFIAAPQFHARRDVRQRGLDRKTLTWRGRAWKTGDPGHAGLSSFAALDAMLHALADPGRFPDLRRIVIAGHSAGGQFVQRYAAANAAEDDFAARGVSTLYVIANPSSYLWLDAARPGFGSEGSSALPSAAAIAACPDYDAYKYGLERLNPPLAALGAETVRRRYGERRIVYLIGAEDVDPDHETLDRSCEAALQGPHRLARSLAFHASLRRLYGEEIATRHSLDIVPGIGHEGPLLFRSAAGLRWLFDG